MIAPNPLLGTGLHAIGGISAASCYLPFQKIKWSWGTFWIVQAHFAWVIVPILVAYFTCPNLWNIYKEAPVSSIVLPILIGAMYGFGSMAFGFSIRHIGYSLTYTISIGLSAIIGLLVPLFLEGTLLEEYNGPGGKIFFVGMFVSFIGIALCGLAGYRKEKDLNADENNKNHFNMGKGLSLSVFAGILSGMFAVALHLAEPVENLAHHYGAGQFVANSSQVLPSLGCYLTNIIWFVIAGIKNGTIKELRIKNTNKRIYSRNFLWSALGGSLWYIQFLFLGMADVKMGRFEFAGWGIHMSMLIFFSFIVGIILKEWKHVSKKTLIALFVALFVLIVSYIIMGYGSMLGEGSI